MRTGGNDKVGDYTPTWLERDIGRVGLEEDTTAQGTPSEVAEKIVASHVCSGGIILFSSYVGPKASLGRQFSNIMN